MASDRVDLIFDILKGKDTLNPALKNGSTSAKQTSSAISGIGVAAAKVGTIIKTAFAGLAIFSVAKGFVDAASKVEDLSNQFQTLTGSAENAKKLITDLTQFAAKTPFQLEGLADASKQLLAFGFSQEQIIDKLGKIGDVAAASGGSIQEISLIYGQIAAQGKLTGERLLQLQERAIPIGPAIAKTMGVAESAVRDLVSKGKVDLATFETAFASLSATGGQFAGGMDRQSKTLSGTISTLKDNFFVLSATIGEQLLPGISLMVGYLTQAVQWISNLNIIQNVIDYIVNLEIAFKRMGTFIVSASKLIGASIIEALVSPFVLVEKAIAGLSNYIPALKGTSKLFADISKEAATARKKSLATIDDIFNPALIIEASGAVDQYTKKIINLSKTNTTAANLIGKEQTEREIQLEKIIKNLKIEFGSYKKNAEEFKKGVEQANLMSEAIKKIRDSALSMASTILSGISKGAAGVGDVISSIAGTVVDAYFPGFGGIIKEAIQFLGSGPENVKKMIMEFNQGIPEFIRNFVTAIPEAIISGLEYGIESFADTIADLGPMFENFIDRFVDGIPRVIDSFIKSIPKVIDGILQGLPQIFTAIVAGIPTIINALIEYFSANAFIIVESFIEALIEGAPKFVEALLEAIPKAAGGLLGGGLAGGGGGGGILGAVASPLGFVKGLFSEGGVIPPGFPNDTFVAGVSSGERVLTPQQNKLFEKSIANGGSDETNSILAQILSAVKSGQQVNASINIGQEQLARVILNLNRSNQRLA